jgi:DNA polymerase III epsilon subunit-like protein
MIVCRKYPGRSFGLNDVALFLGLRVEERLLHHSALVDAELLAQVYIHLATQPTDHN